MMPISCHHSEVRIFFPKGLPFTRIPGSRWQTEAVFYRLPPPPFQPHKNSRSLVPPPSFSPFDTLVVRAPVPLLCRNGQIHYWARHGAGHLLPRGNFYAGVCSSFLDCPLAPLSCPPPFYSLGDHPPPLPAKMPTSIPHSPVSLLPFAFANSFPFVTPPFETQ